jgi:hypothetical protein
MAGRTLVDLVGMALVGCGSDDRSVAWLEDTTVVGYANEGLDEASRVAQTKDGSLMTCSVPDLVCTPVPDSQRAILPEPSLC